MKQVLQQEGHTSYTAQDQRHADAQVLAKMTRMSPYRRNCKLEGTFYVSFDAGVPTHRPQTTRGKMKQKALPRRSPSCSSAPRIVRASASMSDTWPTARGPRCRVCSRMALILSAATRPICKLQSVISSAAACLQKSSVRCSLKKTCA